MEESDKRPRDDRSGPSESKTILPATDEAPPKETSDKPMATTETKHPPGGKQGKDDVSHSTNSSAWLGWLSRSRPEPTKTTGDSKTATKPPETVAQSPKSAPTPAPEASLSKPIPEPQTKGDSKLESKQTPPKRTWLQMWGNDTASQSDKSVDDSVVDHTTAQANTALQIPGANDPPKAPSTSTPNSNASSLKTGPPPQLPGDGSKSSGWVFWGRDKSQNSSAASDPNVGEIAISNTPSQGRPKRASISLQDSDRPKIPGPDGSSQQIQEPAKATKQQGKGSRPATPVVRAQEPRIANIESPATKDKTPDSSSASELSASATQLQKSVPNILLPSFKDTYALHESPTLLEQLKRLLYYTKSPELTHLDRVRDPPRIKHAVAIGVHGYFPTPLIRSVLGQPTGTSIKFANMAAKAIGKWTQAQGYTCKVKTAALEGEGKIAERIELLWKLLLNWIDEIRKADFIMVACHSQGVPVAMMLVAKLIDFGCFDSSSVKIGVCAMAGVNMGPFADYKSRWISGSAGELFEFQDPGSTVSKSYLAALDTVLKFGSRVSFIGSIDDQLVSLESSVFAPISHPHIYRAVFIDGRVHAPNFIVHLVGFVLKLRNLGVPDHGLIRELSSPLAGSLYGGEGHSRIYEDECVYDLAIEFALETTSIINTALTQRSIPTSSSNPYILPFAMRGILEEDYVKTELHNEALDLLKQFDDWKPTTKGLKDVKYRLEAIRSKL